MRFKTRTPTQKTVIEEVKAVLFEDITLSAPKIQDVLYPTASSAYILVILHQAGTSLTQLRKDVFAEVKSQSPTPQQEHARHTHLARSDDTRPVDIANRDSAGRRVLEKERMK